MSSISLCDTWTFLRPCGPWRGAVCCGVLKWRGPESNGGGLVWVASESWTDPTDPRSCVKRPKGVFQTSRSQIVHPTDPWYPERHGASGFSAAGLLEDASIRAWWVCLGGRWSWEKVDLDATWRMCTSKRMERCTRHINIWHMFHMIYVWAIWYMEYDYHPHIYKRVSSCWTWTGYPTVKPTLRSLLVCIVGEWPPNEDLSTVSQLRGKYAQWLLVFVFFDYTIPAKQERNVTYHCFSHIWLSIFLGGVAIYLILSYLISNLILSYLILSVYMHIMSKKMYVVYASIYIMFHPHEIPHLRVAIEVNLPSGLELLRFGRDFDQSLRHVRLPRGAALGHVLGVGGVWII